MITAPIVKWSGSKRSQAAEIVKRFPREMDTYYEPFCGGCSVLLRLLQTEEIRIRHYVVSDINADLIALWKEIRDNPQRLMEEYATLWDTFNRHGLDMDDIERRSEVFYTIRERVNKEHRPADFLFIMRTAVNGMPRYNSKGAFNTSCHFSRPGIHPIRLDEICKGWSSLLKAKEVEFRCGSYEDVVPQEGDFAYLDPPYLGTKGMYYGALEMPRFWEWLGNLKCGWALSFDGRTDKEDLTADVPKGLYVKHEYLKSGNSSFRRVTGTDRHANVEESLYLGGSPFRR